MSQNDLSLELDTVGTLDNKYQKKWETRSSVRNRPRKLIDFNLSGDFFPKDKQIILFLPEVQALGIDIQKEILVQSFYKYLDDIINLEIKLINSACNKLIYDNLVVSYTKEQKLNAWSIMIDEHYHVYVAQDMVHQLEQNFNSLTPMAFPVGDSVLAVDAIKSSLDKKYHAIFEILAVSIFETTLIKELVEFFDSKDVHPSIKYYVKDHMNDEARHYGYFYDILCYTWDNLPEDYQQEIGKYLADFVKLYLNISSEKQFNLQLLKRYLNDEQLASKLIEKAYYGFDITTEIPIVKNVLQVLKSAGIMDSRYVLEEFKKKNLYI